MQVLRSLKYLYLTYFAKPVVDRDLVRTIYRQKPRHLVQIGLGDGSRMRRALEIALWHHSAGSVRFVGIDQFESRAVGNGMSLKQAHAELKSIGTKVQLVPGDPYSALSRVANSLPGNDLVLIAKDQDAESLKRAWYFLPRILHPGSIVLIEQDLGWETLRFEEVQRLAELSSRNLRRAA